MSEEKPEKSFKDEARVVVQAAPVPEPATSAQRLISYVHNGIKLIALLLAVIFVVSSWSDLRALIPRISSLKALGVEIEISDLKKLLQKQREVQAKNDGTPVLDKDVISDELVLARARAVRAVFQNASILWVDDKPVGNLPLIQLLSRLQANVEIARSTDEALGLSDTKVFDLVISDQTHVVPGDAIADLARLREHGISAPAIFYVGRVTEYVPKGALGLTNQPNELLQLIMDGLERSRWPEVERSE